jgi:hypothetical protein
MVRQCEGDGPGVRLRRLHPQQASSFSRYGAFAPLTTRFERLKSLMRVSGPLGPGSEVLAGLGPQSHEFLEEAEARVESLLGLIGQIRSEHRIA